MKLLSIFLALIVSTSCMAQPLEDRSSQDDVDCTDITVSPQLDDCVGKELVSSNAFLSEELNSLEARVRKVYAADIELAEELIQTVREAQEAWSDFRDRSCKVDAFEVEVGTPAYVTTLNNCIIRMNSQRREELAELPH